MSQIKNMMTINSLLNNYNNLNIQHSIVYLKNININNQITNIQF